MTTHITTLGADPEVFLRHRDTHNMISSVGRIGGSKDAPRPIDDEGNAVQEDNVTVEFNIPPCRTADELRLHLKKNLDYIQEFVGYQDLELVIQPSAVFSDEELDSEAARTFGCEPDFNAWLGGMKNPKPRAENPNLRSAGGHIHVAHEGDVDSIELIKWMDAYVGCQLLRFDTDSQRRELYGMPGSFRKKSYGTEYRTPSNIWINDDKLIQLVWDQTDKALGRAKAGEVIPEELGEMVQECINKGNLDLLPAIEAMLEK